MARFCTCQANSSFVFGGGGNEALQKARAYGASNASWRVLWSERNIAGLALSLAFCGVPLSIAVTESLLAVALALRVRTMVWHLQPVSMPREPEPQLPRAGLEI